MKYMTKARPAALVLFVCFAAALLLTGCSSDSSDTQQSDAITSVEDLADKRLAVEDGSAYDNQIKELFPDAEVSYMGSSDQAVIAIEDGKIDAFIVDEPFAKFIVQGTQGIHYLSDELTYDDYAFVLQKDNTTLAGEINEVLEELDQEGVLDALEDEWINGVGTKEVNHIEQTGETKGVLKVATSADIEPFSYLLDGELAGYDIELVTLVGERMGYEVEIDNMEFSALIPAISGGKYDVAVSCITITEERSETLLFTDPVYSSGTVAIVADETVTEQSFIDDVMDNFKRTFIVEDRWKMVCEGIAVTVGVSLAAAVLGTLFGVVLSFPLRSKRRFVKAVFGVIDTAWVQTPFVLILMILYYIVFKSVDISAFWVGVVGFSLDFSGVVAGLVNTGIPAVNKGEIEAAEAMGYTQWQVFRKIIMPQVVRIMFTQYEKSIVELIKGTSVIGYITVEDLTKVGDMIRSRTYEAFFPLIATAVIYFVIAFLCVKLLEIIFSRFKPKNRTRRIRGVIVK